MSFRLRMAALLAMALGASTLHASEPTQRSDIYASYFQSENAPLVPATGDALDGMSNGAGNADYFDGSDSGWYFQAEALILQRSQRGSAGNQAVVLLDPSGDVLLRSGDAGGGTAAGPRLTLGRYLDDSAALELVYWGLLPWGGSASVSGNNDLNIPGDLALATLDFRDADTIQIHQQSELHNAEINYVLDRDGFSLLGGFRYLRYRDQFNIHSIDSSGPDTGESDYTTGAINNLYGFQLGGIVARQSGVFGWSATGKAGIYGNDATQSNLVRDFDNTFTFRDAYGAGCSVAFIGEFNFTGRMQLTDRVALRAGYNVIWVEGVALASDQLDFSASMSSDALVGTGGGIFLHGVNVGLDANW